MRDASGRVWVVKVGKEAQSEMTATRLLWAAGYMTDLVYFEARPENVEREGEWKWDDNPFKGTREFQGLKVMMVLLNNWDIKDSNNVILATRGQLHPAGSAHAGCVRAVEGQSVGAFEDEWGGTQVMRTGLSARPPAGKVQGSRPRRAQPTLTRLSILIYRTAAYRMVWA